MSKRFTFLSCFIAVFALALMAFSPVAFAHHSDDHTQGSGASDSERGSANTPGNDRKEGYEDNSDVPQEPNHGKGSDRDGDAGNDATAYEDGHETTNDSPNAHPSGNDKDGEAGGSGNQGRSESNPDDSKGPMRYEGGQGDDKPTGPGGTDRDDQDGNNGCGNDDDFNDDNNGWCGRPTKPTPVKPTDVNKPVCDADATMPGTQKCEKPKTCPNGSAMPAGGNCGEVLGVVIDRPCDKDNNMANGIQACDKPNEVMPEVDTNPSTPTEGVLGIRVSKAPAVAAAVQPAVAAQPAVKPGGAVLPFTGGDVLVFLAAALGLIAAGALAVRVRSDQA